MNPVVSDFFPWARRYNWFDIMQVLKDLLGQVINWPMWTVILFVLLSCSKASFLIEAYHFGVNKIFPRQYCVCSLGSHGISPLSLLFFKACTNKRSLSYYVPQRKRKKKARRDENEMSFHCAREKKLTTQFRCFHQPFIGVAFIGTSAYKIVIFNVKLSSR